MLAMGFNLDDKAAIEAMRKGTGRVHGIAFIASLLSAAVLYKLFAETETFTVLHGLKVGFGVWLGFVATVQLTSQEQSTSVRDRDGLPTCGLPRDGGDLSGLAVNKIRAEFLARRLGS
jgi:hypothetical protein